VTSAIERGVGQTYDRAEPKVGALFEPALPIGCIKELAGVVAAARRQFDGRSAGRVAGVEERKAVVMLPEDEASQLLDMQRQPCELQCTLVVRTKYLAPLSAWQRTGERQSERTRRGSGQSYDAR
jgi:hypothetical protein